VRRVVTIRRIVAACALVLVSMLSVARGADPVPSPGSSGAAPAGTVRAVQGLVVAENLAVITIEGEISGVTAQSLERRMKRAIEGGADAVVIEFDTPGGEVGAVLEMCNTIRRCPVHTIAWINPNAYSGGAIAALSCNEIVISSDATLGDAAPVLIDPIRGISKIEDPEIRQKQLAPILTEIVDSARRAGYDEVLVQALVSLGVRTWMVEDVRTGRMYFLTEHEYTDLFGEDPPITEPIVASGGEANQADVSPVDPSLRQPSSPTGFRPASGMFDSSLTEQIDLGLSQASIRPTFANEDPANFRFHRIATDGQALLTMKADQIRQFGFTRNAPDIDTDQDLMAYVGAKHLARLDQSWAESAVAFMTKGISGFLIRGFLIVVFLLAMFLELSMPGIGLPGIVAISALALLIVPPMLVGASTWWAVGAILVGVGLVILEILVLPGFGVPGVLGLLLLVAGLIGTFATTGELFPGASSGDSSQALWATATVLLALFAAGAGMFFLTKYTRSIPIANRLVLFEKQSVGFDDQSVGMLAAMGPARTEGPVSIGELGVATTPLKPSGTAEFGERLVDVVAEFGFIDPGRRVRVVSVTPFRVGVELVHESDDRARERTA